MKLCCQVIHNTLPVIVEDPPYTPVIEEVDIELCSIYNEGSGMQLMGINPTQDVVPDVLTRKPSLRRTTTVSQRNILQTTTPTTPIMSNPE